MFPIQTLKNNLEINLNSIVICALNAFVLFQVVLYEWITVFCAPFYACFRLLFSFSLCEFSTCIENLFFELKFSNKHKMVIIF